MQDDGRDKRLMQKALEILSTTTLRVLLNPSLDENCVLPEYLYGRTSVLLLYGYSMQVPIPDLMVTEIGISGTLAFQGRSVETFVPWSAVISIEDELSYTSYDWEVQKKKRAAPKTKKLVLLQTSSTNVVSLADYKRRKGIV